MTRKARRIFIRLTQTKAQTATAIATSEARE